MRKNPYLKQEQEFRPLLMRGSFGNDFLNTDAQTQQELNLASEIPKKTYNLNGVSFDMVRSPLWKPNGTMPPIRNVEMCSTECTQELFKKIMRFNYSLFNIKKDSAKRPVEKVTWFECVVFCNKLSEMLGYKLYYEILGAEVNIIGGNGFRLPTAEEWLAFAKAGTNNEWSGTDNERELVDYAWYFENSGSETHPVATKKPNEWGMYDMSGNVLEWCWDRENVTDTNTSASRVARGGNWDYYASYLRSANRYSFSPSIHYYGLGFRFARTIE